MSSHIKFKCRVDVEESFGDLEVCIIELEGLQKNIIILSMYRALNSSDTVFQTSYKTLLEKLQSEHKHIIIGSDHNYDLLKSSVNKQTKLFLENTIASDMWPVITKPTRITKSTATLIDNIIVSNGIYSDYQCAILLEDLSDHLPCILIAHGIKIKTKERVKITSRKITPKTLQQIKTALRQSNLSTIVDNEEDISLAFEKVHTKILDIIDDIAPYEEFTPSKNRYRREAWMPFNLLKSVNKQKALYKRSILLSATDVDCLKYKQYRNTLTKLKRWCKCKYYQDKCVEFKSNTKALWSVINKLSGMEKDKTCVITHIKDGDISYNNTKKIANVLNNYFSTVGRSYAN